MKTLRLRLGVRVPNEGARRLAHWIMREPIGTLDKLLRKIGMGQIDIERMMAGELTPDAFVGHQIFAFTRCNVPINDWDRDAAGGWFDPVVDVATLRRAA
jgi:hypothetical protein